jgi:hypothetical protein
MSWLEQPRLCSVWCTGLSGGAPDSVRCARLALVKRPLPGFRRRRTAKIHRTVRWANGRSSQRSAAQSARDAWLGQRYEGGTGLSGVHRTVSDAPTAPNLQRSAAQNRKEIRTGQCPVVHRTVRCASRQKARIAFLECSQRLLAALGL